LHPSPGVFYRLYMQLGDSRAVKYKSTYKLVYYVTSLI
jgi:hypothetical protein